MGLIFGIWLAGGIDFRRFRTPSLQIFGVILGLLAVTLSLGLGLQTEIFGLGLQTEIFRLGLGLGLRLSFVVLLTVLQDQQTLRRLWVLL